MLKFIWKQTSIAFIEKKNTWFLPVIVMLYEIFYELHDQNFLGGEIGKKKWKTELY